MPCCGILLRHFALYINLSQHRWAEALLWAWRRSLSQPAAGWALPRAALSLSKQGGCPAMVWLLPRAAPLIADAMGLWFFALLLSSIPSQGWVQVGREIQL